MTSEGVVRTKGLQEYKVSGLEVSTVMPHTVTIVTFVTRQEGDVLGFSYDHVELNVFCNGKNLDTPILGIKGTVFPVFYGIFLL